MRAHLEMAGWCQSNANRTVREYRDTSSFISTSAPSPCVPFAGVSSMIIVSVMTGVLKLACGTAKRLGRREQRRAKK